jgi:hypothetical protein
MRRFLTYSVCILAFVLCLLPSFAATPTNTLPIVYITTTNNQAINSKETYVTGSLRIDPKNSGYPALASVPAQFKGRGNWTWNGFDKKPYRIKFDTKQAVLGMPNNRHWCLLAYADDYLGFLKGPAGFIISEALGLRWTPRIRPVELVINNQYQGLYFLTEHVRIAGNRVHITEQADNATDSVTGGWLVEIDNYWSENNIEFDEGNGQHVMVSLKEPEVLSSAQRTYLENQIYGLNDAIYGSSSADLWNRLDLDEAVKFYLVQEIMEDCESYHGSCFLYKDRDRNGQTDKWKFGPVWDFGNAYDRHQETWIYDNPVFAQYWIGQLATWPEFQQKVREYWWVYYHTHKDSVRSTIRAFADQIESAAKRDAEVWKNTQNYRDNSDFSDVRDRFFRRYDWRINWLYSQWNEGTEPNTWDIESTQKEPSRGHKILRDGHLLIECDGRVYNLLGQTVR